jgi:hypothetical protein
MSDLSSEIKVMRSKLSFERLHLTVSEIVNMCISDPQEIDIHRGRETQFTWNRSDQTNFIEKLLLGFPVREIFFVERSEGTWGILGGLEEICTLLKFLSPRDRLFPGWEKDNWNWNIEANNINYPLILTQGEFLSLDGFTFQDLPVDIKMVFKRTRINCIFLKRDSDMGPVEKIIELHRGKERQL